MRFKFVAADVRRRKLAVFREIACQQTEIKAA
jgi:hypothetical protein